MSVNKSQIEALLEELRENNIKVSPNDTVLKLKFNGPKPSPELIQKLKTYKQAILDFLKEKQTNQIPKVALSEDGYMVSSSQFRLWILSQIEKYSIAYNMPFQVFLKEEIQVSLLEKSIFEVIKRHESLRTVFKKNKAGEVRQWIISAAKFDFSLAYTDVSHKVNGATIADREIRKDYQIPFDLENGPLIRFKLFKLGEKKFIFYFNMHHIISDGWSIQVFSRDVMQFYKSLVTGESHTLPVLEIQYKDYAAWQQKLLNATVNSHQKSFWEAIFEAEVPTLELLGNATRPATRTSNGHLLRMYLSEEKSKNINTYITKNEGTLFMFLIASLNTLLYHYSGTKDITIGTPVAGREHVALEDQIGFYVNTLAIRTKMDTTLSFEALYNQVKKHILEVYAHQKYPFDQLVEDLNIKTNPNRNPLFDVFVILQNFTNAKNEDDFKVEKKEEIVSLGNTTAKFDLTFSFVEMGGIISVDLNYNTAIYNDNDMQMLLTNYKELLEALTAKPTESIQDFHVIIPSEMTATHKVAYDNFLENINDEMSDDF